MSSTTTPSGGASRPEDDRRTMEQAASREASSARAEAGKVGETVRDEAAGLASSVKQKAFEGVEQGKSAAASSLSDFTAAIRKASDELGTRDQSMAAGLARQAASGLEQAADALSGQSVQDLTRSVADFARRQPTAFLLGAALAGVALGRFARASGDHAGPLGRDRSTGDRYDDDWRRENLGAGASTRSGSQGGTSNMGYGSTGSGAQRPGSSASAAAGGYGAPSTTTSASSLNRPGASGSTDTTGLTGGNPAASSSQADATGGQRSSSGASPIDSALNKPGASGSTGTAGLSGTGSSSTGDRS